jgi:DNA repair photolyase
MHSGRDAMKANLCLPVLAPDFPSPPGPLDTSPPRKSAGLPRVEWLERKGPVLHPSPMVENGEVLSLNLAMGCAHRCPFCFTKAFPTDPGDDVIYLFADTDEHLARELACRRQRPRAVYVSPSTDPFAPLVEVQAEAARVVEVLAGHGVGALLMTRGFIRPAALRVLAAHREQVRVTVGLTTLDRDLRRVLEPLAAPPRLRLRQVARLRDLGIPVHVALEPLLPGLTDTRANLEPLLDGLADAGVGQVTAGYLFLRQGIRDNLARALEPHGWAEPVLDEFVGGPALEAAGLAPARYLPKARRQRGYAALMALAAERGITVGVSALTNPDFRPPNPAARRAGRKERLLPLFRGRCQDAHCRLEDIFEDQKLLPLFRGRCQDAS